MKIFTFCLQMFSLKVMEFLVVFSASYNNLQLQLSSVSRGKDTYYVLTK